jgi:hypothetical protein
MEVLVHVVMLLYPKRCIDFIGFSAIYRSYSISVLILYARRCPFLWRRANIRLMMYCRAADAGTISPVIHTEAVATSWMADRTVKVIVKAIATPTIVWAAVSISVLTRDCIVPASCPLP